MRDEQCCATTPNGSSSSADTPPIFNHLKAVAHPVRWRMLELMAAQLDGMCVCDLEAQFDLSQPTISHHLRIMREAGVVVTNQRGTWIYYSVAPEAMLWKPNFFAWLY
jgi:ArsR family transcriptional regulator